MTRRRPTRVAPEREGKATWRQGDARRICVDLSVADGAEAVMLLEVAAGVYETLPPRSQADVHTVLTARGVRDTAERVRAALLSAIADVVDPDGAQLELEEAAP